MARATLKLKRPITQFELDLDENSLEAVGFIQMSGAKTNADRIRSMTDEELAEWISCNCTGDGYGNSEAEWHEWLKQEVKGEE